MRETKYRVWCKHTNKMYNFEELESMDISGYLNFYTLIKGDYANYIPLQYTGIKDRNGNEIYDGDIVTADEEDGLEQVVFKNGAFYLETLSNHKFDDELLSELTVEVKGNIYKNPEFVTS